MKLVSLMVGLALAACSAEPGNTIWVVESGSVDASARCAAGPVEPGAVSAAFGAFDGLRGTTHALQLDGCVWLVGPDGRAPVPQHCAVFDGRLVFHELSELTVAADGDRLEIKLADTMHPLSGDRCDRTAQYVMVPE